jgi:hypothetical protein
LQRLSGNSTVILIEDEAMNDIASIAKLIRDLLEKLQGRILPGCKGISARKHKQAISNPSKQQTIPAPAAINLGNILIASGQINREQLDYALEQQKNSTKKIGELLVENGYLHQKQVDQGLHIQCLLVAAALGSVVAIYPPVTAEAGSLTASFNATASVRRVARVTVLHQQPQIVITAEDIAHGHLEMPAASRLEVRNTSLSGYMIAFEVQEGPFRNVLIRGLGTELQISHGSGWLLKTHIRGPEVMELTYRFILAPDTKPGTYPWPIQVNATAI